MHRRLNNVVLGCRMVLLLAIVVDCPNSAFADAVNEVTVKAKYTRAAWNTNDSLMGRPLLPAAPLTPPASVADFVQQQPGVAYAGQGGLLQTLSIRGISGQQVANFWGDIPIISDRRAGTSSSFIDPVMLGSVEILRGPASVYYGNGAAAGALQLTPARPGAVEWQLQWESVDDQNLQYLGVGNEQVSLAISRRVARDSETADGTPLHTGFEQYNAQLLWDAGIGQTQFEFQQLFSAGQDIGKSNVQFPMYRITDYLEERHWLGQLSASSGSGLRGSVFYHYQSLDTRVEYLQNRINEVASSSVDWGFRVESGWLGEIFPMRLVLDYFERHNVTSNETETAISGGEQRHFDTLDAQQGGVDLAVDGYRQFAGAGLWAGVRWAGIGQSSAGQPDVEDSAISAFVRGEWSPRDKLTLSLEVASGVRFAGLSERYFTGTTGRGSVIGNTLLNPEDTLGFDLDLRWCRQPVEVEIHAYGIRIDDYIERVDIADGVRTFRNLNKGEIRGMEAALALPVSNAWRLTIGGHYVEGTDSENTPLANITPAAVKGELEYVRFDWRVNIHFSYRFSKAEVAPGELPVDNAVLLSAGLSRNWPGGMQLRLWGRNLLNERWRLGTDHLATEGPERSVGITLSWTTGP